MRTFEEIAEQMRFHGMKLPNKKTYIKIPGAADILKEAMNYFVGSQMQWIDEYNRVANWLEDNNGKGLLLYGQCGRGKTILARYAIPAILLKYSGKVVSCYDIQEMNKIPDTILSKHIISLDDIGTEEIAVKYGERRSVFSEIVDSAEKNGKLLIISSNLGSDEIKKVYGNRILDRLISITTRVSFNGKSFRR